MLRAALLLIGVVFLASYIGVAVLRMRAPFDLEWIEGGSVANVRQVLHGHQLYQRPSLGFTPFLYTPLYYYVSAVAARVFGIGYFPLRLVSFMASLAAFATIAWWVAKETGDRLAGAMAACLLAACFRIGGAWFDLARVDSLFLALLLAGLAAGRFVRSPRAAAVAAGVLVLAFLTKQEAILPALALVPFLWRRQRRIGAVFLATFSAGLVFSTLALQWASSGWYLTYVLGVPTSHELIGKEAIGFWTADVAPVAAALIVGVAGLAVLVRRRQPSAANVGPPGAGAVPSATWFYLPVVGSLVAVAWAGRLHSGGYDNVLLPAYAGAAVLFGIGLSVWCPRHHPGVVPTTTASTATTASRPGPSGSMRLRLGRSIPVLAGVVVLVQFALLAYNPAAQVPSAADGRAADHVVAQLRALRGSVYLPGHPWYVERAGKEPSAQSSALADVLRGPDGPGRSSLRHDLDRAIVEQRFDNVVTDSAAWLSYLPKNFTRYYRLDRRIATDGRALLSRTGIRTRPAEVWVPRSGVIAHPDRAD